MQTDPNHATTGPLPEMSRHEASWHEHLAGMRAAEAARAKGADPTAVEALASATAGPLQIGAFNIRPASQGTIWTLQRVAREWEKFASAHAIPASGDSAAPGTRELIELGLATLAFCDARECWLALDRGEIAHLVEKADAMMWEIPVETQLKLQNHFQAEMARIGRLAPGQEDAPGKPPETPAGTSPASETPPPATASPPWNG